MLNKNANRLVLRDSSLKLNKIEQNIEFQNLFFLHRKYFFLPSRIFVGKPFYLPHMEYEGSIGLVMRKMNFFSLIFIFIGP
jgi:hypothetical protein